MGMLLMDGGEDCFDGGNDSDGIDIDNDHRNVGVEDEENGNKDEDGDKLEVAICLIHFYKRLGCSD